MFIYFPVDSTFLYLLWNVSSSSQYELCKDLCPRCIGKHPETRKGEVTQVTTAKSGEEAGLGIGAFFHLSKTAGLCPICCWLRLDPGFAIRLQKIHALTILTPTLRSLTFSMKLVMIHIDIPESWEYEGFWIVMSRKSVFWAIRKCHGKELNMSQSLG